MKNLLAIFRILFRPFVEIFYNETSQSVILLLLGENKKRMKFLIKHQHQLDGWKIYLKRKFSKGWRKFTFMSFELMKVFNFYGSHLILENFHNKISLKVYFEESF